MAHPSSLRSLQQSRVPSPATLTALRSALWGLSLSHSPSHPQPIGSQKRHASHATQGRANGAKDGAGKRLGAKKGDGEYVVPGNILFKQRGTLWFPGDGCFMGRDHTIHAKVPGYVKYYRDPSFPKRKYIGVVFNRAHSLPQPPNAVRRRMLGMLAYRIPSANTQQITDDTTPSSTSFTPISPTHSVSADTHVTATTAFSPPYPQTAFVENRRESGELIKSRLMLRRGYQWREPNHEIGTQGLKSKAARKVRPYVRGARLHLTDKERAVRRRFSKSGKGRARKGKGKGKGR